MRLLFLSLVFPLPANNGHRMRTWALLRALAAEGHEVSLLSFGQAEELNGHSTEVRGICRAVELVPLVLKNLSSASDYFMRVRGLFSALPYAVQRFSSAAMRECVSAHLARGVFDAVVCDTIFSAANLPPTPLPIVLNNVDVEHLILRRYIASERNPAKRLYAWMEAHKVRKWEEAVCRRATLGMACSEHDKRVLQALSPGMHIDVVPNVVDTSDYLPQEVGDPLTVLYQGGMDWFPNQDAVEFFVSRILPVLRGRVPGVRFVVAGRNPSEALQKRYASLPDVDFTGTVPDIRPVIAQAAVCVVPLRMGSGTRLKILEGAAMAKPIVSTRIGAEGLDFVEGEEIVLADEPWEFAEAVAGLLMDADRRCALGQAARRRVEAQYNLSAMGRALGEVLAQLTESTLTSTQRREFRPASVEVRP